jgi:hypothetical protein
MKNHWFLLLKKCVLITREQQKLPFGCELAGCRLSCALTYALTVEGYVAPRSIVPLLQI